MENVIGDHIFTSTVSVYDGADKGLWHALVVGKQLFGIFRQTVTAVAEAGVVVVATDARVEPYAFDDLACVQPL